MRAESKFRLVDVWVGVRDPRQATKVEHDLIELLVVSVSAVLSGADTFVEIEAWAKEKVDWLRQYLKLEQGIPSHERAAWPWATPLAGSLRRLIPTNSGRPSCAGWARCYPCWRRAT